MYGRLLSLGGCTGKTTLMGPRQGYLFGLFPEYSIDIGEPFQSRVPIFPPDVSPDVSSGVLTLLFILQTYVR